MYSVYIPSVGVVGLAEYICTHPILNFLQRKIQTSFPMMLSRGSVLHATLPVDRVTRRKLRMTQDSDDLFVVNIVVWVLVVILAIVALHCPVPCRVVR